MRRTLPVIFVVIVLLALGAGVAGQVGKALGIEFRPSDIPAEHPIAAPARPFAPGPPIGTIVTPDDKRIKLAAAAVPKAPTGVTLTVALKDIGQGGEAYRLRHDGLNLVLEASTPAGAAAGLYTVADRLRSGDQAVPEGDDNRVVVPRLGLRLTDTGSVGFDDDPRGFVASDDYSLNTDIVGSAILSGPPYVDTAAVDRIAAQFRQLVDRSLMLGYNGIVVPGFLEYLTLDGVYPAGDPHIARAKAMVAAFGPVWQYAHDMGMKVYMASDMLALSPPLKTYLGSRIPEDPGFWPVYQKALRELFRSLPYADAFLIRIGEGGASYKYAGWDYTSEIAVKTPKAVRAMLTAFLSVAGDLDKDIVLRTWSIGVGAVGDMHTNPASYNEVLGGLNDPHLIVSTKYSLGDYYSYLPLNDTLMTGSQRRIVEFQARREFEGLGAFPNDLGTLEQIALQRFLAANPHIEGVWNWSQIGGPLRAGPRTLYLRAGFWQIFELNSYATARLAENPDADPADITADWARQTFSGDESTVEAISRTMALSRAAVMDGLYIGPFANRKVKALGLEPPPMMWIFEWDIVTGDSAVLNSIYTVSKDHLDEAIAQGDQATDLARQMRTLIGDTDPATWRDPVLRQHFVDTLDYEIDLFGALSAYRAMFLRYAQWLDTGSDAARTAWERARDRYVAARDEHLRRYTGNVDLPAYRFPAADIGLQHAERDHTMAWLARILLGVLVALFYFGWRLRLVKQPTRIERLGVVLVPGLVLALSRGIYTWFAAPVHLGLVLAAWLVFAWLLRVLVKGADPFRLWLAVGGAVLLRTAILLVALADRGPGRYWFNFWTSPRRRDVYITIAFAAFLWTFVAVYRTLRTYGLNRRRSAGRVLVAAGAPLVVLGAVLSVVGLERALTAWNDEMALLPWGLSRILGITVFLDIPPSLPQVVSLAGGVLFLLGVLLVGVDPRLTRPQDRTAG